MSKAKTYRKSTGGPNATFFQAVFNIFSLVMFLSWPMLLFYCLFWLQTKMDYLSLRYQRDPPPVVYNIPPKKQELITRKPYVPQEDVTSRKPSTKAYINCEEWMNKSNWNQIETESWTSSNTTKNGAVKTPVEYLFLLRCPFELVMAKDICKSRRMKLLTIDPINNRPNVSEETERVELFDYIGMNEIAKKWNQGFFAKYVWTDYITRNVSQTTFPASHTDLSANTPTSVPYCADRDGYGWRESLADTSETWSNLIPNVVNWSLPIVLDFEKANSDPQIGCAKFIWPDIIETRNVPNKTNQLPQYYTVCRSM